MVRPPSEGPLGAVAAALLLPLSAAYWLAVSFRNLFFDLGAIRIHRVGVPVVSVGNITTGGTGKTPFVILLAGMLAGTGRKVAVVSRGYRRKKTSKGPLVVSDGTVVRCDVGESGDEPMLIARRLLKDGVLVLVGADRVKTAEAAASLGAEIVILDDGFQHRRLHRDMDIVLLDAEKPLDNGLLLPASRLRESPGSLWRADAVVLTRSENDAIPDRLKGRLRPGVPIYHSQHRHLPPVKMEEWRSGKKAAEPAGFTGRALLFSGIARPDSFEASARQAGLDPGGHLIFPDHHRFVETDLRRIESAGDGYDALVTTEKDAVRLPDGWSPRMKLLVLGIELVLVPDGSARQMEEMIAKKVFDS